MKKILTVSFVALISVISAGNAAIPDKNYVDTQNEDLLLYVVDQDSDIRSAMDQREMVLLTKIGNKVDKTDVAEKGETVAGANSDKMVPTVARMDDAISTAEENAATYTDGKIAELAETYETKENVSLAVQEAKDYADDKASEAGTDAKSYADEELLKKVDKTGHAASQVVITDSTGAIATAAQIPNTQVSGLGDLATKSTIADADVAADAAIAQSKVDGLTDALGAKVDKANIVTKTNHTYDEIVAKDVAEQDTLVPSFAIMYDMGASLREKILENVSDIGTNSGEIDSLKTMVRDNATDIAGKVDKAAVVVSGGTNTMTGATVANDANKDTYVPTVAYAQQMAASAASDAVSGLDAKFQEYVPYAMGEAHADGFVVTDATGNVYVEHGVPASITDAMDEKVSAKLNKPEGECLTPGNCVLVFSGYTDDGEITLVWEKVARSISDVQAE